MKLDSLLRASLLVLSVLLAVTIAAWIASDQTVAWAQGGGGSATGDWMMVSSELHTGEGLVYVFNAKKEVLLVYAYHRGRKSRAGTRNRFDGDFQFLAGRLVKWDVLYVQLRPYPLEAPKSGMHTPEQVKSAFEKASGG